MLSSSVGVGLLPVELEKAEGGGTRDAELEESEGIARPTSNAGSNAGSAIGQLRARMPGRDRDGRVAELHVDAISAPHDRSASG